MHDSSAERRVALLASHMLPHDTSASRTTAPLCSTSQHHSNNFIPNLQLSPCAGRTGKGGMLEGKVAIVTGAGKGIGEATAKLLASEGAAVVVADLDEAAAQQVVREIEAGGGRAVAVAADVTAADAPQRIVDAALRSFGGKLHIIVNNAGFTYDGVLHKMSATQWQIMLDVHMTAPFRILQAASPAMRDAAKQEIADHGKADDRSIINISSTSGTHGNAGQTNYGAAKAGVCGLTKSIAKEWGPFNIRCNAIAFGLIDTRLTRPKEDGESIQVGGKKVALGIPGATQQFEMMKGAIPLQRMGTAQEAAGAVLMLASPLSSYITGQVLEVSGGAHM